MFVSTLRYEHITVTGTPLERGLQYGTQAKEKIHFNIAKYQNVSSMPKQGIVDQYIKDYYLPAIAAKFPRGLEEMKGIAQGSGARLEDIIMLNARYDLSRMVHGAEDECTSMALTIDSHDGGNGEVYIAQNWDITAWLEENNTIVVLQSIDPSADNVTLPRSTIMLTEAGQLGRSGMNSLGMAVCANGLWSSNDFFPSGGAEAKPFMPISLARRMVIECGHIGDSLKALWGLPRHTSSNLMIGDKSGLTMDVELAPEDKFIQHPQTISSASRTTRLLTHSNHFTSAEMLTRPDIRDAYAGSSSYYRNTRLFQQLEHKAGACGGQLGVKDIKSAFSDHAGYPQSVCEHKSHSSSSKTVACVIYDLARLEMHVSMGNPCERNWSMHALN